MEELVRAFWNCIDEARFEDLRKLMAPQAAVTLPNTRERFAGRERFIAFNRGYPGRWRAAVEKIIPGADGAISFARVWNPANGEPPPWRLENDYTARY